MQEKTLKKVWYGSIVLYIGTLAFVSVLTPCIVPLIFKLCHWNKVYEIYILSNVFTYFASVWGGSLNAYRIYGFDKILHFSSGWLIFFKNDCINHYTQGVHDSITDMLCAVVAGICLTVFLVLYYKNGRRSFFVNIYEKFYDRNIGR